MIGVLCLCPWDSYSCRKPIMWRRCVFLCIYMFSLCSVCFSPHLNLNDLASCYSFGQFTVFTHWWKEQQCLLQSPMFATSDTLPGNSGIENTIIAHLTHKYTGIIDSKPVWKQLLQRFCIQRKHLAVGSTGPGPTHNIFMCCVMKSLVTQPYYSLHIVPP